jgi:hypothetical protein
VVESVSPQAPSRETPVHEMAVAEMAAVKLHVVRQIILSRNRPHRTPVLIAATKCHAETGAQNRPARSSSPRLVAVLATPVPSFADPNRFASGRGSRSFLCLRAVIRTLIFLSYKIYPPCISGRGGHLAGDQLDRDPPVKSGTGNHRGLPPPVSAVAATTAISDYRDESGYG